MPSDPEHTGRTYEEPTILRRALLGAAGTGVAGLLAGCTGGDDDSSPPDQNSTEQEDDGSQEQQSRQISELEVAAEALEPGPGQEVSAVKGRAVYDDGTTAPLTEEADVSVTAGLDPYNNIFTHNEYISEEEIEVGKTTAEAANIQRKQATETYQDEDTDYEEVRTGELEYVGPGQNRLFVDIELHEDISSDDPFEETDVDLDIERGEYNPEENTVRVDIPYTVTEEEQSLMQLYEEIDPRGAAPIREGLARNQVRSLLSERLNDGELADVIEERYGKETDGFDEEVTNGNFIYERGGGSSNLAWNRPRVVEGVVNGWAPHWNTDITTDQSEEEMIENGVRGVAHSANLSPLNDSVIHDTEEQKVYTIAGSPTTPPIEAPAHSDLEESVVKNPEEEIPDPNTMTQMFDIFQEDNVEFRNGDDVEAWEKAAHNNFTEQEYENADKTAILNAFLPHTRIEVDSELKPVNIEN